MRRPVSRLLDDARIMVDHIYRRLDYGRIWLSLVEDLPSLRAAIERYRAEG